VKHKTHAGQAKQLYEKYAGQDYDQKETLCISADLKKVIMLPRLKQFKEAIFTRCLTIYHETFVPVGHKQKAHIFSVPWHSAISGGCNVNKKIVQFAKQIVGFFFVS
jgi:hypothetical protein